LKQYALVLTKTDKEVLTNPDNRILLSQAFSESYRQGAKAGREAALLLPQTWGFEPEDISFNKVFIWHGEKDKMMPVKPAEILAKSISCCIYETYKDEGHLSLLSNHADNIFTKLTQATN
jgi:pimeloyl-ACP methyl ester carboxylesterase